ncbi:MAG: InlB B-repeat-containing protein, partial [Firmicutes bacterium]|nr:InlB B-repeat-containing protein [Bacillota bacterium]
NNGKENVKTVSVKFEKTLGKVDGVNGFVPSKPDTIPNGYVFEGWYLNPECTGDKVDFNATKMPSANLVVYAHWVPIVHTVNIDPRNGEETSSTQVPHGTITEESKRPADPTRGVYTFVGWFYEEDGKEKAFDFASMQVTKDLNVYAKWSSNTLVEYTINYQLEDGTEIANPTKGQALAGNSKTFEAKVDTDLYADYQEGYFPKEASHTVVMDIEGNNVFTFVYKPVQSVPYTVKYVDDQGKELRPAKKVEDNKKAVVTEYALTIQGYLPNKFQQRLILTADGVNEIVFIYTEDNTHAMVSVTHITVNAGVETEYKHYEYVGEIGTVYTEEQLQIPNYRFESVTVNEIEKNSNEENSVVVKEKLTSDGLNIVFKYVAQYHVVYSSEPEKVITNDVIKNENVTKVHAGYLYGGLYENATYNLDAAYTNICGADFQPTVGATYYVKEVSDQYLRPTQVEVSNRFTNQLYDVYLTTAIDSDLYDQVGFVISGEYCPVNAVYNKMVIQPGKNSEFTKTEFNASDITVGKVDPGLIASVDYAKINMDDLKTYTGVGTTSGSKTIKCYWVTLDGVRVTGAASRYLTIKESDKDKNDYIEVNADPKEIYFVDMNVLTTAVKN